MNKLNKRGFTLVELIIVIAVIAILATVLIPTFNSVIKKARASAALQEARSAYEETLAMDLADGVLDGFEGDPEEPTNTLKKGKIIALDPNDAGTDYAAFTFKAANDYTVSYSNEVWGTPQPPTE